MGFIGPASTIVLACLIHLLRHTSLEIPNPPAFIILTIVYAAFADGLASGLLSAFIGWIYFAYFFSEPTAVFTYSDENQKRILVWAFTTPAIALMVGRLKENLRDRLASESFREIESRALLTEAHRAADSARESEARFRQFADSMTQLAFMANPDGHLNWYNERWYEYTGTDFSQMEGWGWQKVMHPEHLPAISERWTYSLKTGEPFEMTFPIRSNDGSFRTFLTRVIPIKDTNGHVLHWFGTNTDINDQQRAERKIADVQTKLEISEAKMAAILESAPVGILVVNEHGIIDYMNRAGQELWGGFPNADRPGEYDEYRGFWPVTGEALKAHEWASSQAFKTGRSIESRRVRILTLDGQEKFITTAANPVRAKSGEVIGTVGINQDITDLVHAEQKLTEQLTVIRTIADNATSCLFMMDKNGHPTFMNPAAEKLTGYKLEEIQDRPLHYAVHYKKPDGSPYPMEECPIDNAQAKLKPLQNQQEIFVDKSGRLFPVAYSVAPLEEKGVVVGSVLEFQDITERKTTEEALRNAKDEAERANQLKSAFLANMSHEIRTPLGAMIGFADLLRDPGLTQTEKASYVDVLMRNGENLAVIINDILDLSKVEAGHLALEFTDIWPAMVAEEVVSLLRVKAKEKGLVLEYTCEESSPEKIVADSGRLRQILINLVGNAIKFTQFGSVKIRSYGCRTPNNRHAVCYEIADTGIGVPESQKEKIFEMFVQGDGSMTRRFGGTGLGLALSKRLAIEMGGDVSILETKEGIGTTFKVMIEDQPAKRVEGQLAEPRVRRHDELGDQVLKDLHILVVDDAPDNQQLIWRYLTKRGAIVESAENGLLGYRAALTGDFDLVLMDIQMPVMDGYTATQKLRENGYRKPIIALTAHAMSEVRKKALNIGYTDHLTKPINAAELVATIARHTIERADA